MPTVRKRPFKVASRDFLEKLRIMGYDQHAADAAGVTMKAVIEWKKAKPEFLKEYDLAKSDFKRNLRGGELNILALLAAKKILLNGKTVLTKTLGTRTTIERYDKNNNLIYKEVITVDPSESFRTYSPSESLIGMFVDKEDAAFQYLTGLGYEVRDPRLNANTATRGLTTETVNMLKTQMFGLENVN
ncbi:MAG: hypothetical protein F6J98_01675 [Moorea sp. SIO4G2]|nr:hypothetical protein [Moorena sp. SIO4G2]